MRAKGASDVVVADAVAARIDAIKAANPDTDIKLIDSSVTFTLGNYESAMHTLYEGAALAVLVVFLFLRDIRATLIAAITLPLSILPALWAMDVAGFSLNVVSLLAITLSTGILVDDAIVEIENIVRHMRMGKSCFKAAIDAADEIGLAVVAIFFVGRQWGALPLLAAFCIAGVVGIFGLIALQTLPIEEWARDSGYPLLRDSIGRSSQSAQERAWLISETIGLA